MVINNWPKVKNIIVEGIKKSAPTAVIGISILDVQTDLTVLKINDMYALTDRDGVHGKFTSPEKAWEYMAQVCMKTYIDELDRNKNK